MSHAVLKQFFVYAVKKCFVSLNPRDHLSKSHTKGFAVLGTGAAFGFVPMY